MKRTTIFLTLASLFFLASCQKEVTLSTSGQDKPGEEQYDGRIRFSSSDVPQMCRTRAVTESTTSGISQNGFFILATDSDGAKVFDDIARKSSTGFFEPQTGPYYYPQSGTMDFYAIYPWDNAVTVKTDSILYSYTQNPDKDVVVAGASGISRQSMAVQLNFSHILSQAAIVCTGYDYMCAYHITSATITAPTSGKWEMKEGKWIPGSAKQAYDYVTDEVLMAKNCGAKAIGSAKSFIPGTYRLTVSYYCTDKFDATVGTYTKTAVVSLTQGKICTINATLPNDEAEQIRFTITTEAWQQESVDMDFTPAAYYAADGTDTLSLPGFTMTSGTVGSVDWGDGTIEAFTEEGVETKSSLSDGTVSLSHKYDEDFSGSVKLYVTTGFIDFGEVNLASGVRLEVDRWDKVNYDMTIPKGLCFYAEGEQTLSLSLAGELTPPRLEYTYDGTWHTWDRSALSFGTSAAPVVFIRGKNPDGISCGMDNYATFTLGNATARTACSGNIMHLIDTVDLTEIPMDKCFYRLFKGCTALVSGPELPATTLKPYCYSEMFEDCTSLLSAPALPAEELNSCCYKWMFKNCSSLKSCTGYIHAASLASEACKGMFQGCSSLTDSDIFLEVVQAQDHACMEMFKGCTSLRWGPNLATITSGEEGCFANMYEGCTSLNTTPTLALTSLPKSCYSGMFAGCKSLTTAPALPVTTLSVGCYMGMFRGCTSLTAAPVLPATTLQTNCYTNMFRDCSSLNYIKMMSTKTPGSSYTGSWVSGVASTGTFVMNSKASYAALTGENYIPEGWTVETATQ